MRLESMQYATLKDSDARKVGCAEALESGSSDGLGLSLSTRKFAEENGWRRASRVYIYPCLYR